MDVQGVRIFPSGNQTPLLSIISHFRLVLEPMAAAFSSKRRCATAVEKSNVSGDSSQSTKKSSSSGDGEGKPTGQRKKAYFICYASYGAMKHFRPRMVNDGPPSSKPDASPTPKKSRNECFLGKPKLSKTPAKEVTLPGLVRKTRGARASASSCTLKSPEFLDIIEASEEKRIPRETEGDEAAREGLATEESSNTSAEKPSSKDGSKAAEDVDLDEVDGFLNDDILVEAENIEVCLPILRGCLLSHEYATINLLLNMLICWNSALDTSCEPCYFVSLLIDICVLPEPTVFPKRVLSPEKQASVEEWASWHEVLDKLRHSIANEAKVLSSIEKLIPSSKALSSQVDFRGVKVHSRPAEVLGKFFEHADDTNVSLICLSPFVRRMIFEEFGLLLYATLGVPVGSLVKRLGELRDTLFGLQLENEKGVLDQFIKVNKLIYALELMRKELESSKKIAACLQLATDQLHAGTSSSSSEKWCSKLNFSPSYHYMLCLIVCIFLTFSFFFLGRA
ncbi:hypothetical protein D8674_028676 [Pyrus ussuriensis x Pyrus communis]|uniref:Uncharacterized protein n=1 Tax=Pyrus ussuriensis x Pyrus communis TaxID=2448454 RepID=A0A5N5HXV4_9ROSA|nr:hypothetical protein D8674_028676 [Pyrus ussuriensis x Pyrus communis]